MLKPNNHALVLKAISLERERQEALLRVGRFKFTASGDAPDTDKVPILGEEFGEVCKAVNENNPGELYKELIQTAAVAAAWAESLL